jgi:hypothetical protein
MERAAQFLLIASTMAFSWLAMQAVHEFGHVLHAWVSGGSVVRVVLHPLTISRTDVWPNPHPLFVAWGGAIWGCVIPVALFALARLFNWRYSYLVTFFAGFCLIANGVYLGAGSFTAAGDAGDLMRHGAPRWSLILFGAAACTPGLWFWHGLGPHFGLASARGRVDGRVAVVMAILVILLVVAEVLTATEPAPWF